MWAWNPDVEEGRNERESRSHGKEEKTVLCDRRRCFFFKYPKKGDFGRSRLGSVIPRRLPLDVQGIWFLLCGKISRGREKKKAYENKRHAEERTVRFPGTRSGLDPETGKRNWDWSEFTGWLPVLAHALIGFQRVNDKQLFTITSSSISEKGSKLFPCGHRKSSPQLSSSRWIAWRPWKQLVENDFFEIMPMIWGYIMCFQ